MELGDSGMRHGAKRREGMGGLRDDDFLSVTGHNVKSIVSKVQMHFLL